MKRLKFDNDTLGKVTKLVQYHDYRMPAQPKNVRRAMNKIGEELFPCYLEVRKADTMAQSEYMREEKLSNIAGIERCYKEILKKKECVSLKMLAVTGSDLIADGMQPGKQIGAVLQALLELVSSRNTIQRRFYWSKAGSCARKLFCRNAHTYKMSVIHLERIGNNECRGQR